VTEIEIVISSVTTVAITVFAFLSLFTDSKKSDLELLIAEKEKILKEKQVEQIVEEYQNEINELEKMISSGTEHHSTLSGVLRKSARKVERIKVGLLPPTFKYDDSESLKKKVTKSRKKQFKLIKNGEATTSYSNWDWYGSRSDGKIMLDGYNYLLLKAFNAEFEFIRKQMRHSTYDVALRKLERLEGQLERLGETANVSISWEYRDLKINELDIWHNELVHKEEVKQEKKLQRELLREQNKQGDDADEIEDEIYERKSMLEKSRKIAQERIGLDQASVQLQIKDIQKEIDDLNKKFERAKSQAQITKAGYIYVISNIGSFGDGVVKIGMTRRLEPLDRVYELSGASVPFKFDVHTLAFVEDAPAIEKKIHNAFENDRVNIKNNRKEFFKVPVNKVKDVFDEVSLESDWFYEVEAKEYRESVLIRETMSKRTIKHPEASSRFPNTI